MTDSLPQASVEGLHTVELTAERAPLLQAFFEANPAYFLATQGEPAGPGEALEEITSQVPPDMPFTRKLVVGYLGPAGDVVAMANVITDLLAVSIHHIGTFIVSTNRHGSGLAQELYGGLEDWARVNGAVWLRLGVVQGNTRAERFWKSQRYVPVRERPGIQMGSLKVTVQNMVKPLYCTSLDEYYSLAPRDRPGH